MSKKRRPRSTVNHTARSRYPLAQFLERAYLDWQRSIGAIRSQEEFAEYLGLKLPTFTKIRRGEVEVPQRETIEKIADKCGPGIYDALGMDRPDPLLQALIASWGELTIEQQRDLAKRAGIDFRTFIGRPDSRMADVDASPKDGASTRRRVRSTV